MRHLCGGKLSGGRQRHCVPFENTNTNMPVVYAFCFASCLPPNDNDSSSPLLLLLLPCAHRFGECGRQAKGECALLHDPSKVAVCLHWLAGACSAGDKCKRQHKVVVVVLVGCLAELGCLWPHVTLIGLAVCMYVLSEESHVCESDG